MCMHVKNISSKKETNDFAEDYDDDGDNDSNENYIGEMT